MNNKLERLSNSDDFTTRCVVCLVSTCSPELSKAIKDLHFLGCKLHIKSMFKY